MNTSSIAFVVGLLAAGAVVFGVAPVKPWLYVAGGLVAVGFVFQPATPGA